jgi:hypothetical protein
MALHHVGSALDVMSRIEREHLDLIVQRKRCNDALNRWQVFEGRIKER